MVSKRYEIFDEDGNQNNVYDPGSISWNAVERKKASKRQGRGFNQEPYYVPPQLIKKKEMRKQP